MEEVAEVLRKEDRGQSNSGSDGFDYDVKQEGKEYKRVERNVGGVR